MTPTQMARVAREVTQQPWKYLHGHVILDGDEKLHYWNPNFEAEDWMRSQALAVVEWLADNIYREPEVGPKDPQIRDARPALILWNAIRGRDVNALITLAHQLLENEDG